MFNFKYLGTNNYMFSDVNLNSVAFNNIDCYECTLNLIISNTKNFLMNSLTSP